MLLYGNATCLNSVTLRMKKKVTHTEEYGFHRKKKSVFTVTSIGTKHILNSYGETVLKLIKADFPFESGLADPK